MWHGTGLLYCQELLNDITVSLLCCTRLFLKERSHWRSKMLSSWVVWVRARDQGAGLKSKIIAAANRNFKQLGGSQEIEG